MDGQPPAARAGDQGLGGGMNAEDLAALRAVFTRVEERRKFEKLLAQHADWYLKYLLLVVSKTGGRLLHTNEPGGQFEVNDAIRKSIKEFKRKVRSAHRRERKRAARPHT